MISLAKYDDINEIMRFIDKEWRKDHILARDREFFEYMYVIDNEVCFVISRDDKEGTINGILGFIPYDKGLKQISLTVWKALSSADGMVGIGMLNYLIKHLGPAIVASPGINPQTTIPLYKFLKYETGKMAHFYRLSRSREYKIASVKDDYIAECPVNKGARVIQVRNFDDFKTIGVIYEQNAIKKEDWYIKHRYFEHPIYQYKMFFVEYNSEKLVIIAREQKANGGQCLKVVDLIGKYELLPYATEFFDIHMKNNQYEYVDCYFTGIKEAVFKQAGWENREERDIVIPNYFEPFEQQNIDLYYSTKPQGIIMLRGDSDQDRPN
jgi:uncharacterized protein (UPF0179 family)